MTGYYRPGRRGLRRQLRYHSGGNFTATVRQAESAGAGFPNRSNKNFSSRARTLHCISQIFMAEKRGQVSIVSSMSRMTREAGDFEMRLFN